MNPLNTTDDQIRAMTPEQLSDLYAALEVAEIQAEWKTVSHLDAALWYARSLRWPVFPIVERGKRPLTRHGFKDASTDPDQIRAWWTRWPEANIGIPTGHVDRGGCGYDVIDVDGPEGIATIATLKHDQCPPDCTAQTFCHATGSLPPVHALAFTPGTRSHKPGRHYYTPAIGSSNTTRIMPGVDLRGDGGYVVAPPSVGETGARYTWLTRPSKP